MGRPGNLTKVGWSGGVSCAPTLVARRQSSGLQRAGTHPAQGSSAGPNQATVAQRPHTPKVPSPPPRGWDRWWHLGGAREWVKVCAFLFGVGREVGKGGGKTECLQLPLPPSS